MEDKMLSTSIVTEFDNNENGMEEPKVDNVEEDQAYVLLKLIARTKIGRAIKGN